MAPKRRRQPQAINLLELRDEVDEIASRVDNANTIDWPAALLEEGEEHAKTVQKSVEQLLRSVKMLVKTVMQKKRLLCSQQIETDGYYTGRVKIGLAQLKQQTVPTISSICSDFKRCNSLGYFVASVGKDVLRDVDVRKISGSSIEVPGASQSKSVYLSPRNKQDKLHGLACFSLIAHDNQTGKGKHLEFNVPDLSWRGDRLDPRELLCSTVQNAREDDEQPYLVVPTESSPHWLESIGLPPYLLDCGEQLKKTARPIPGVHTSYLYISGSRRSSSPLHVEDAFLGSINLVLAGAPKVWLMVEPRFRAKLEERVRQHLVETDLESEEEGEDDEEDHEEQDDESEDDRGEDDQDNDQDDDLQYDGPCSQFVRHQSSLLSPKLLDSWGIPYRIVVCEAGQMMVTLPGAYHEVVNAGPNMAIAINFAPSDWTGPPEDYRFCRRRLHRIRPADLRIRQEICGPGLDNAAETREEPDGSSGNSLLHRPQEDETSDQQRDKLSRNTHSLQSQEEEKINDQQDEHTNPSSRPQGEDSDQQDESPCDSPSNESQDEDETEEHLDRSSHNSPLQQPQEQEEEEEDEQTDGHQRGPSQDEERSGNQRDKPSPLDLSIEEVNGVTDSTINGLTHDSESFPNPLTPEDPSLHEEPRESSIASTLSGQLCDTPTPLKASTTPSTPGLHSLILTPATTIVSEPEAQQCNSLTGRKDAEYGGSVLSTKDGKGGDPGNPCGIASNDDDDVSDSVKLSLDELYSAKIATVALETRLNTLIEILLPVAPGFNCSEETIKRFSLGSQLNDEAIMLALGLLLPGKAQPLIAAHAIRNRPTSLSHRYTEPDISQFKPPHLKHILESRHLFIACNVEARSLSCNWTDSGDHWILIIVDFDKAKVHVLGDEEGHKAEAEAIAYNISLFVNNYRRMNRVDAVDWSSLETHPLYPTSGFPDNYNCGVAVISRAEEFFYPDRALSSTSAKQLHSQLDERRVDYLERVIHRCTRVARDEREKLALLTPASSNRKRPFEYPEETPADICVKAVKLTQRTAPSPVSLATIPETDVELWQECLRGAAEERGFYVPGLREAFRRAPKGQDCDKVVRVLQYVCEVANAEILLQLKGFLREPTAQTERIGEADKELVDLHLRIRGHGTASFMAQAKKLMCQLFYYDWFQSEANRKRAIMHLKKNERKKIALSARRNGLEVQQRNADPKTALNQQRKYAIHLITSQTDLDEASVHADVNDNYHKGEILNLLLNPRNGQERREARFLYLLPLYEGLSRPPLLNVKDHKPPITTKPEFSKKISTPAFWRFINIELARFFGEALSIARPELDHVESCLPVGSEASQVGQIQLANDNGPPRILYLLTIEDTEIRRARPQDVARLLKPISSRPVDQSQLELREAGSRN